MFVLLEFRARILKRLLGIHKITIYSSKSTCGFVNIDMIHLSQESKSIDISVKYHTQRVLDYENATIF